MVMSGSKNNPGVVIGPNGKQAPPAILSPAERQRVLLNAYDGVFASAFNLAPYNPDSLLSSTGYKILRDQMTMGAVLTPLNIVRTAVLAKGVSVQAAVQDESEGDHAEAKTYADALEYDITHIENVQGQVQDIRHVVWDLASAIHYGFKGAEILWKVHEDGPNKGKLGFRHFSAKPTKQIGFTLDLETLEINAITSYTPMRGYQFGIPLEKFLLYTFQPEDGLPYGISLGRAAYKHSWSLDFIYKFWNICLEVFGTPFLMAKSPKGSIKLVAAILNKIRAGAPAVLPNDTEAQLIQMAGGSADAFMHAAEHHSNAITAIYEHSVLTSGEGQHGSTSAGSDVHQDTSDFQHCFVRTDCENVLNGQLVRRWMRYNYGADKMHLAPTISLGDWDATDMGTMASAFATHIKSGVMHPSEPQIRVKSKLAPITPDAQAAMDADKAQVQANSDAKIGAKSKLPPPKKSANSLSTNGAFGGVSIREQLAASKTGPDGQKWITLPNGAHVPIGDDGKPDMSSLHGGAGKPTSEKTATKRTKSEIAKQSATLTDKEVQRYSEEHNEPVLSKAIGGHHLRDNEPVDVMKINRGKVTHGVELKTMVANKANKITMSGEAIKRKHEWMREHNAPLSTVVYNDQSVYNANGKGEHDDKKRTIHYKRGFGSFNLSAMHQVKNHAELKTLLNTPDHELPKKARPPKSYIPPTA